MRRFMQLGAAALLAVLVLGGCANGVPPGVTLTQAAPTQAISGGGPETAASVATTVPADVTVQMARVQVSFDTQTAVPGDTVVATVSVAGVNDLYGVQVSLLFDAEMLEVVDQDLSAEGIQVSDGDFLEVGYMVQNETDPAGGTIGYAVSQMPPSAGAGGDGVLLRVVFRAKAPGVARLEAREVILAGSDGGEIPVSFDPSAAELRIE